MRKITTILLLAVFAVACSADNPEEGVVNVDLEGNWVLESVSCFCYFEPDTDFSAHRISFEGSRLIVLSEGNTTYLAEEGSYSYSVEGNLITLPDGKQYRYHISEQKLELSSVDDPMLADAGVTFIFYKN